MHENGLEFELKCMKTGVMLLENETKKSEEIIKYLEEIFVGVKALAEGDFEPLMEVGKNLIIEAAKAYDGSIRERWYKQEIYLDYLAGFIGTNPNTVDQIERVLMKEAAGKKDWHVFYAALLSLEKVVLESKNEQIQRKAMGANFTI